MKWSQLCLGDFLTAKIPKNKRGLTSLHLASQDLFTSAHNTGSQAVKQEASL